MKIRTCAALLALSLVSPGALAHPLSIRSGITTRGDEATHLRERCDASLETLRAGRTAAPTPLPTDDRLELRSAESRSADLLEMRAGELTDRQWTLVAVGALIVIIIILL